LSLIQNPRFLIATWRPTRLSEQTLSNESTTVTYIYIYINIMWKIHIKNFFHKFYISTYSPIYSRIWLLMYKSISRFIISTNNLYQLLWQFEITWRNIHYVHSTHYLTRRIYLMTTSSRQIIFELLNMNLCG